MKYALQAVLVGFLILSLIVSFAQVELIWPYLAKEVGHPTLVGYFCARLISVFIAFDRWIPLLVRLPVLRLLLTLSAWCFSVYLLRKIFIPTTWHLDPIEVLEIIMLIALCFISSSRTSTRSSC